MADRSRSATRGSKPSGDASVGANGPYVTPRTGVLTPSRQSDLPTGARRPGGRSIATVVSSSGVPARAAGTGTVLAESLTDPASYADSAAPPQARPGPTSPRVGLDHRRPGFVAPAPPRRRPVSQPPGGHRGRKGDRQPGRHHRRDQDERRPRHRQAEPSDHARRAG